MIRAVLFDLDGTLLDTAPDFAQVLQSLLAEHDRPPLPPQLLRQAISGGGRAMVEAAFDTTAQDPSFEHYLQTFLDAYARQIETPLSEPFPGIVSLLAQIEAAGLPWGIVTNKNSRFTLPLLERIPSLKDCPVVICPDMVGEAKPHPAGLLAACQQLDTAPQQAIYLGDHPRDVEAGRNAGMITMACRWGYLPSAPDILQWQADHVVQQVEDVASLLLGRSHH